MSHLTDISSVDPEPAALDMLTEWLARDTSVLPISTSGDSIHVILPIDHQADKTVGKLQFVLNLTVTYDTAPQAQISQQIARHYPRPNRDTESLIDIDLPESLPAIDRDAAFRFLDLDGEVVHTTSASVSFHLGHKTSTLTLSDGSTEHFSRKCVFNLVGWLDAHFPCHGFHKLLIRCSLPTEYVSYESMRDLVPCVAQALGIPGCVSYSIHLSSQATATSMEHPPSAWLCTQQSRPPDPDL